MRLGRRDIDTKDLGETWQPKLWVVLIALAVIAAYSIAFIAQNTHEVSVDFVLWTAHVSLIWVIILTLAIGLLAGLLLSQAYRHRTRRGRTQPPTD